jgi:uncharacterized protein (TIGR03663 family)
MLALRYWRPAVFAAIVAIAAALRLPGLDARPMHADEAVHAAKFGRLLEHSAYRYDPQEYHGPTLNYLTLIPARVRGTARYADLDETTLRAVPAFTGVLLVAAHALLVPMVGFGAAALAALFAAVSPGMVYYSRYYIQETLLVAFSFGALVALCRYLQAPRRRWAVAAGLSIGLMAATKETWVIAFGSMAGAWGVARVLARGDGVGSAPSSGRRLAGDLVAAGLSAIGVACLFYSSFFSHPRGIVDSITAYSTYVSRASATSWHVHPWHYYLGLLLRGVPGDGPFWTEAAILGLGLVGLFAIAARGNPKRGAGGPLVFLAAYAVLMIAAYSAIPYKTPWCVTGFLDACAVVAGVGAAWAISRPGSPLGRSAVSAAVAAVVIHLGWLAWSASFPFASDPRNPYVYAHTGTGVFEIAGRAETLARADPRKLGMPVEVISGRNLWPLPWYLRHFSDVRWETAPVNDGDPAPLILATPDMESAVGRKLYEWRRPGERELYVPIFEQPVELRPQVEVRGYAAKSLWDGASAR